jgi:ribosomal protein S12
MSYHVYRWLCPEELWDALERAAHRDGITVAQYLVECVQPNVRMTREERARLVARGPKRAPRRV